MDKFLIALHSIDFAYEIKIIEHIEQYIGWANEAQVNGYLLRELSKYTTIPVEDMYKLIQQLLSNTSLNAIATETNALEVLLFDCDLTSIIQQAQIGPAALLHSDF